MAKLKIFSVSVEECGFKECDVTFVKNYYTAIIGLSDQFAEMTDIQYVAYINKSSWRKAEISINKWTKDF